MSCLLAAGVWVVLLVWVFVLIVCKVVVPRSWLTRPVGCPVVLDG